MPCSNDEASSSAHSACASTWPQLALVNHLRIRGYEPLSSEQKFVTCYLRLVTCCLSSDGSGGVFGRGGLQQRPQRLRQHLTGPVHTPSQPAEPQHCVAGPLGYTGPQSRHLTPGSSC